MSGLPLLALTSTNKADLVQQLSAAGIDPADATVIVDLAVHAVNECGETLVRVASTAGAHLRIGVFHVALQILHELAGTIQP